jgi:hypothetical protein
LLGPVPVKNQAITEGQTGSRIGCVFITVEDRASKSGLDMANDFSLEAIFTSKSLGLVALPGFTLRFRN